MASAYTLYVSLQAQLAGLTGGLRGGGQQLRAFDGQLSGTQAALGRVEAATERLGRAQIAAAAEAVRAQSTAAAAERSGRAQALAARAAAKAQAEQTAAVEATARAARAQEVAQTMAARAQATAGAGAVAAQNTAAAAAAAVGGDGQGGRTRPALTAGRP
ncbi:hypothetical protein [Kitasatospora cineracea]|uniref:hypothetical protein n=1 Tax=Kitasatospora cineracea TaxID=88074 RepID=UPI00382CDE06